MYYPFIEEFIFGGFYWKVGDFSTILLQIIAITLVKLLLGTC